MPDSRIRSLLLLRHASANDEAEIAVDWTHIADGYPRRLRRGVDFSGSVLDFVESARSVAAHTGRSVIITRDRADPDRFVWIQFADSEVAIGDPCPCGGRRLTRMTAVLLRCDSCGSTLVAGARPKRGKGREGEPARADENEKRALTLTDFSEVRLTVTERSANVVEYVGLGVDDGGGKVVLVVHVPLVAGQPVQDPRSPTGEAHRIVAVVPEAIWGAPPGDGDQTWDIVVA